MLLEYRINPPPHTHTLINLCRMPIDFSLQFSKYMYALHWITCTIEPLLKDRPMVQKTYSRSKWSLVTGWITLKCKTFCLEYLVFQDRWSLMAVVSLTVSREVSLYRISTKYRKQGPDMCAITIVFLNNLQFVEFGYMEHLNDCLHKHAVLIVSQM